MAEDEGLYSYRVFVLALIVLSIAHVLKLRAGKFRGMGILSPQRFWKLKLE